MDLRTAKKWFNVYYAQNQEDLILKAFLPELKDGFYIDVGAHDPEYLSVTKIFYESGWSGINIEPQKRYHLKLSKERKRDINLNVAIGKEKSMLSFREYPDADGLSTLSDEMKKGYLNDETYGKVTENFNEYNVQVITLNEVFDKYCKNKQVDFIKLDIEGYEKEALMGNDWMANRPTVVCIESNHEAKDWHGILEKSKYIKFFYDGLNDYFVPEEKYSKISKTFNYPETVLRKIPLAATPLNVLIKEISALTKDGKLKALQLQKQNTYIKEQESHIIRLNNHIDILEQRENKKLVALALKITKIFDKRT